MTSGIERAHEGTRARRASVGVLVATVLLGHALPLHAETTAAPGAPEMGVSAREFPSKLSITVVADERALLTFQQRVSSWFTDDANVSVSVVVTSEVDEGAILATSPGEVRAWIVPLSPERALVSFSTITPGSAARHLVREVPLRNGLDELGLERLASVIHSAFVALREGEEGASRAEAERELGAAGLSPESRSPPAEFASKPAAVPTLPETPRPNRQPRRANARATEPPASLLFGAGYGGVFRGAEGFGHGPELSLGVQLPSKRTAIDLGLSGQFLFRSPFDAELFDASVQTTALRVQAGIEPQLAASVYGQVLVGVGADIAQIHSSTATEPKSNGAQPGARADGTQWRSVGQLSLGVIRRGDLIDLGVYARINFSLEDVHYSATTDNGEQRLVTPWPIQPGLFVQGRFRSAL